MRYLIYKKYGISIRKNFVILLFSLLLLIYFFIILWEKPGSGDLDWGITLSKQKFTWTYPFTYESINPFFGMNSSFTPYGNWYIPSEIITYLLYPYFSNYAINAISNIVCLLELWVGILLLAHILKASLFISILSIQLIFFSLYSYLFNLYILHNQNVTLAPQILHLYLLSYFLLSLFMTIGNFRIYINLIIMLIIPFVFLYGIVSLLGHFSIIVLSLFPFFIGTLFVDKNTLKWKIVGGCLLVLLFFFIFLYIDSSANYTTRRFFPDEIIGEIQDDSYASISVKGGGYFKFFISLVIGFIFALWKGSRNLKIFSIASIVHVIGMSIISHLYLFSKINWVKYPLPHYLEQPLYPIYILVSICGYSTIIKRRYKEKYKELSIIIIPLVLLLLIPKYNIKEIINKNIELSLLKEKF